jgi:S-formylglutathione hydrolase FrmB
MSLPTPLACFFVALLALPTPQRATADDDVTISPSRIDEHGWLVHDVRSPYQAGQTLIRVLLPDPLDPTARYPVIYVLPVEAGSETRYGDGLAEVQKLIRGQNRYDAIFVAPTFSHLPWYADHPRDPQIRQESHLLKVVIPFVEKTYPARAEASGRLLLGFSKSGWGAYALLLRHPDLFARAAAWDAPLMLDAPGRYGSGPIFGTADNFAQYQVSRLLERHADEVKTGDRLILLGYGNFRDEHHRAHDLMQRLGIEHAYADGPARAHTWSSGWLPEAIDLLLKRDSKTK